MRTTFSGLPITSRIGFTFSNASASPPTMIDSVPLTAPISPPLTGASSICAPSDFAFAASRRATPGAMLLLSMMIVPRASAPDTPSGASGPLSPSAHRRVDHLRAERLRLRGKPARNAGRNAAVVDDDRAALERAEHTVRSLEHLLHIRRVGHHRDQARHLTRDVRGRLRALRAE